MSFGGGFLPSLRINTRDADFGVCAFGAEQSMVHSLNEFFNSIHINKFSKSYLISIIIFKYLISA